MDPATDLIQAEVIVCNCNKPICQSMSRKYDLLKSHYDALKDRADTNIKVLSTITDNLNKECPDPVVYERRKMVCGQCQCKDQRCMQVHQALYNSLDNIESLVVKKNAIYKGYENLIKENQRKYVETQKHIETRDDMFVKQEALINSYANRIMTLTYDYNQLNEIKTDPHGRDVEVQELRQEVHKWNTMYLNVNATLVGTNKTCEIMEKERKEEKQEAKKLNEDFFLLRHKYNQVNMVNEALRNAQPEELKSITFTGQCRDYICSRKMQTLIDTRSNLTAEIDHLNAQLVQLKNERTKALADAESWMQEYTRAKDAAAQQGAAVVESPEIQIVEVNPNHKLAPTIPDELGMKMRSLFCFDYTRQTEADEGVLYDMFMEDQEPDKRMHVLDLIYSACHNGSTMSDKDKRKYKDEKTKKGKSRMFKSCFSACLRTMNGISKKKGTKLVWTNVHPKRKPVFAQQL